MSPTVCGPDFWARGKKNPVAVEKKPYVQWAREKNPVVEEKTPYVQRLQKKKPRNVFPKLGVQRMSGKY